jgi:SAM-dependent methyltransferase
METTGAYMDNPMPYIQDDPNFKKQFSIRRSKLLAGINLDTATGVEIGALCRPFVRREDGPIIYVDYTDTDSLSQRYANDPMVDITRIVDVDAIWGENTLIDAVKGQCVDYVVASHVVEHVPDLVAWLREIASILHPTGELRLIVPDKRFTFDYFRRESSLSDVLLSHVIGARIPQPHSILDFALNAADVDTATAWRRKIRIGETRRGHTLEGALTLAKDAIERGIYHDVHCWTFTPASFALILRDLASAGLIDFACEGFYDPEYNDSEFFVRLRRSNNIDYILQSWTRMHDVAWKARPLWRLKRKLIANHRKQRPPELFAMHGPRIPNEASELDPVVPIALPPDFRAEEYLQANPDVRAAGSDPAQHYLICGWKEGRKIKLPDQAIEIE